MKNSFLLIATSAQFASNSTNFSTRNATTTPAPSAARLMAVLPRVLNRFALAHVTRRPMAEWCAVDVVI